MSPRQSHVPHVVQAALLLLGWPGCADWDPEVAQPLPAPLIGGEEGWVARLRQAIREGDAAALDTLDKETGSFAVDSGGKEAVRWARARKALDDSDASTAADAARSCLASQGVLEARCRELLARARELAGYPEAARREYRALVIDHPGSPSALHAQLRLAYWDAADGDWESVVLRLAPIHRDASIGKEAATRLSWMLAWAYEQTGRPEAAASLYHGLFLTDPEASPPEGTFTGRTQALEGIEAAASGKAHVPTADDWIRRASMLRNRGLAPRAVDELEAVLRKRLSEASPSRIDALLESLSETWLATRDYPRMEASFRRWLQSPEADRAPRPWLHYGLGRALGRQGRYVEALEAYADMGRRLPDELIVRRDYYTARVLLEMERVPEARRAFESAAAFQSPHDLTQDAAWRLAFDDWQAGKATGCLERLEALEPRVDDFLDRLRVRYWRARAMEALGRRDEGERVYRDLVENFPPNYYSALAAHRLGRKTAWESPCGISDAPACRERRLRPTLMETGASLTLSAPRRRRLERADRLLRLGCSAEALEELQDVLGSGPEAEPLVIAAAIRLGEEGAVYDSQRLIRSGYASRLRRPFRESDRSVWEAAYARGYVEEVTVDASAEGLEPHWVYAIVQEESRFQPDAVSSAGALGLMQLMPATAKRLAEARKEPLEDPEELLEPSRNLALGTRYLGDLSRRYRGNLLTVAAAYNGGPHNVDRWLSEIPFRDWDEFVEQIPYSETRRYVKKVVGSLQAYNRLYGGTWEVPDRLRSGSEPSPSAAD